MEGHATSDKSSGIFTGKEKAESAKFEAEQLTKSTDGVAIPEPWKQIFPPQICQVLLKMCIGRKLMPRYSVTFEIKAAPTVSVDVDARDAEEAIQKAERYAIQTDKTMRLGEVLEVIEIAP